jgi:uncharacterized membrane protein YidH (DUF202 family)
MASSGSDLALRRPSGRSRPGETPPARGAVGGRAFAAVARGGLVARGVVYAVIGVLALKLALGYPGGKTVSQQGALQTIAHQTLGLALLVIVALGLAGYALWRLVSAAEPSRAEDRKPLRRIAAVGSAVAYMVIFASAVKILLGAGASGGSASARRETAGVLGWPAGPELVAIAGLVLIGVAVHQGYKGAARKFLQDSPTDEMSPGVERAFTALGVAGHVARAVVFALIGYGVIRAAIDYSPKNAIGLDGALHKLSTSAEGPLLLGIVAAGLIAFALYSVADACYRKI